MPFPGSGFVHLFSLDSRLYRYKLLSAVFVFSLITFRFDPTVYTHFVLLLIGTALILLFLVVRHIASILNGALHVEQAILQALT